MLPTSSTIDWARCLLAYEAVASKNLLLPQAATFLVYEKLRGQLCAPMGVDGFQTFASRALMLAQSQAPGLDALQVAPDGGLEGLDELQPQTDPVYFAELGLIFIAQLLALFLTFLGPETTRRLLQQVFSFLEIAREKMNARVNQLKNVSERLEALADKYTPIADGLMTIAGNTRNLASILEVLVVIRSRSNLPRASAPGQAHDVSSTGYVM
jgi:hypothetical protein